tara:strand:+ start:135 stop:671 length:537 start_codon:yes stop_codon:yes gene_type:complete
MKWIGQADVSTKRVITESEKISSNDNDITLPTSAAVKDYVDKRSIRVYGDTIKILPSDWMANEDAGATKTIQFVDNTAGTTGLKAGAATTEILAFVDIPEGKKATHVDVYDNSHNLAMEVFEVDINAGGGTSKGSGNCNTTLDITDVNATATNFLMILVTTVATSNRVFGGKVTIADQ